MLVNMPVLSLVLFVGSLSQGGARSRGFALGYFLSGFQPFGSDPPHVGCYESSVVGSNLSSSVCLDVKPFPASH